MAHPLKFSIVFIRDILTTVIERRAVSRSQAQSPSSKSVNYTVDHKNVPKTVKTAKELFKMVDTSAKVIVKIQTCRRI